MWVLLPCYYLPYYYPILYLLFPYYFLIMSSLCPHYYPITSLLFPHYVPIITLLLPYYFLIMSPLLPYYFLIISSLCPHYYPIMYLPITLWLFNITMENCPFIDGLGFPIKNCDFPWLLFDFPLNFGVP